MKVELQKKQFVDMNILVYAYEHIARHKRAIC